MCGLVGCYQPGAHAVTSKEILIKMRDQMTHRGPDGASVWRSQDECCVLGHRRLSIIDLSDNASQPMANHDGSVIIVFNGEVYNHAELRAELNSLNRYQWCTNHSDTEVILHAYEEWGLDAFQRFKGMFAVAIYDTRNPNKPQLHLVRDRIGIKPLYFHRTGSGEWIFASEIRAILAHPDVKRDMDKTALWHYLTFVVTPAPMTLFRDIWKLPAGYMMTIDHRGDAKAWQWWDCKPTKDQQFSTTDLSFDDACQEVLRLLRQSISRRMVSDVPFGVLLSGGVDSSLNVALMSELMNRPVTTFTIGYDVHEESNEFHYAKRVAERYQTHHHEARINADDAMNFLPLLVQLQDEPIADNVCIPLYFLAKLVKESGTTVVQVGEGADENYLGYWWCDHYLQKYNHVYQPAMQQGKPSLWQRLLATFKAKLPKFSGEDADIYSRAQLGQELFWGGAVCWWGDLRKELTQTPGIFSQSVNCPVAGLLPLGFTDCDSHQVVAEYTRALDGYIAEPSILYKIPYLEHKLRLPEHLLMRVDKMSMAHSIEARVPFLDHDLVEFNMRIPPEYKLNNGLGKRILKKVAEPFLDKDLLYRRKQGFGAPMEGWFKEKEFGRKTVSAFERSPLIKEGFMDKRCIQKMLDHQMGSGGGYSFHLWTALNAVIWYDYWIENNADCF